MFSHFRKRSIECFLFLIEKYKDELINQIDRLGRTVFHLIIQDDLFECISDFSIHKILFDNLLTYESNGDCILDYFFIYNAKKCFNTLSNNTFYENLLYKEIRNTYPNFIEKCVL